MGGDGEVSEESAEDTSAAPAVQSHEVAQDAGVSAWLSSRQRARIAWGIVLAMLVAAFFSTIGAINREFYGSSGIVNGYLQALAQADTAAALRFDGVTVPDEGSRALLDSAAIAGVSDIRIVSDVPFGDQARLVTASFMIAVGEATPRRLESTFRVAPAENRFWLFESWQFVDSPIGTLDVRVLNDSAFRANGMQVDTPGTALAGDSTAYLVFTPGLYRLDHESRYLTATPRDAVVAQIGEHAQVSVEVTAKPAFVDRVQSELDAFLDACTEQAVLFPKDCPFGHFISNRIITEPVWSITEYPVVQINGTGTGWLVPRSPGSAHLRVDVQSIFDGSVAPFNEDIPFTVSYAITFTPSGSLSITALP